MLYVIANNGVDFVPAEITATSETGAATSVTMHDGSVVRFRQADGSHDPSDRDAAYAHVPSAQARGEVPTGLLHIDESAPEMHAVNGTVGMPLVNVPYEELCPGSGALEELQEEFR